MHVSPVSSAFSHSPASTSWRLPFPQHPSLPNNVAGTLHVDVAASVLVLFQLFQVFVTAAGFRKAPPADSSPICPVKFPADRAHLHPRRHRATILGWSRCYAPSGAGNGRGWRFAVSAGRASAILPADGFHISRTASTWRPGPHRAQLAHRARRKAPACKHGARLRRENPKVPCE